MGNSTQAKKEERDGRSRQKDWQGQQHEHTKPDSVWRDPDSSVLLRCSDSPSTGEGQSEARAALCLTPIQSGSCALPDVELQRSES